MAAAHYIPAFHTASTMPTFAEFLQIALLILVVVMVFNVIIFVHELGHFLAARWRGLKVDRFQIWFGKPIWKKTIGGVQYGLGWLPFGGFVALPQLAPMETLEGAGSDRATLPPVSALDKIIVAFAGPLFSILLALVSALLVWKVGKPKDFIPTQTIGEVIPGGPAEKAGLRAGDRIIAVNGKPVEGFAGSLDSIFETVVLSTGPTIEFTVERAGESLPLRFVSAFETPPAKWYQRRALRRVGISPLNEQILITGLEKHSPGRRAGLREGDVLVSADGRTFGETDGLISHLRSKGDQPVSFVVRRGLEERAFTIAAVRPLQPADSPPLFGISFAATAFHDERIVHPTPFRQVGDSLRSMWTTLSGLITPKSSIGIDHLSGPVGIAKMQYQLLKTEDGWRRILAFMVLFNVNLAVLNLMPFPVLDGGHITLALLEKAAGRPVKAKVLEVLQTACALLLISLMLFVTSKDIGDSFGAKKGSADKVVFPAK